MAFNVINVLATIVDKPLKDGESALQNIEVKAGQIAKSVRKLYSHYPYINKVLCHLIILLSYFFL